MTEKEKAQQRFKKIIISKNLKELISHFDFEKELKIQYEEGLESAPDTDLFIEDRIKSLEENVQARKSSVSYDHNKFYELGDYIRIGYSWVIKGIRGSTDDFETMTYRNLTLNSEVPPDRRHGIYYILLAELARGASIAFHISFLRKELKKMLRTSESNMRINHLLPTFQIYENDRLWLQTVLESSGDSAKQLSERFGKVMQDRQSLTFNSSDTSLNKSRQLDYAIPQSTIASLSAGEVVGVVADNPDQPIPHKMIHAQVQHDLKALEKEEAKYRPLPEKQVEEKVIREIFLRIKREAKAIVEDEMDRIVNTPGINKLVKK
ncbi:hypothetical protein [Agriterribacter sp.]|uniref:hypothetical protein n=1 Tax=Agriterribacter sp. TaxID=2821509 RepID=UPI002B640202|nr:hypothetical protein [Agriterribacter sp.]HTN05706.1 hypothetical protein [Agriterribacter sp.]